MSDKAKRIAEFLKNEYGIHNPDELLSAVDSDCGISIGIFTKRKESGGRNIDKV